MLSARRLPLLLALAGLLAACGREPPLVIGTTVSTTMTVTVTGDESFTFSGEVPLRIVIGGVNPGVPESLRLLNLGLLAPVTLEDGRLIRPAFDLLGYGGDGSYQIGPGATQPSGSVQPPEGIHSDAFIEITRLPMPTVTFNVLRATCSLEVSNDARAGLLECPKIADEPTGRRVISLRMQWVPS